MLTVFLALGAWRMSKKHVLTRRMPASRRRARPRCCASKDRDSHPQPDVGEPLSAERFTSDATGTLCREFHELLEFAVLASESDPFDPMEKAFRALRRALARADGTQQTGRWSTNTARAGIARALPHVWRVAWKRRTMIAAKGAPEAVADLCHLTR